VHEWTRRARTLDAIEVWGDAGVRLSIGGRTEMVRGMRVSAGYLDLLGARMQLGRSLALDDDERTLVLTDSVWRELFNADSAIVGRTISGIGAMRYRIAGVLSGDFHPLHMSNPGELPRLYMPVGFDLHRSGCDECPGVRVIGRLARGVRIGEAQAEMRTISTALARESPAAYPSDVTMHVVSLRDRLLGRFGTAMTLAQAVAVLFLLLACASVATLLVAQATRRRQEIAVRAALGASRLRIVRQLLVESLLLAGCGGALGIALAWTAMWFIVRTAPDEIPRLQEMTPDQSMLVFGVVVSLATGVLFGLAPALHASRVDLRSWRLALRQVQGRREQRRAMNALVTVEVTLAFVVMLAVGVLGKSYVRLLNVDAGFDARQVLTLSLMPDALHYGTPERRLGYFDAVVSRARQIPGVDAAGYASTLPLSHPSADRLLVLEHPPELDADAPIVDAYLASPDYFAALTIPVRRGRAFTSDDRRSSAPVALISESAARTIFRGEDPIGRHIQVHPQESGFTMHARDAQQPWATIVGIVGDVRQYGLDVSAGPAAYLPFAQAPNVQGWASLVVHARTAEAVRLEAAVRGALVDVDPTQPQFHVQTMDAYVSKSVAQRTFTFVLVAACGAAALLIATLGVYSVVAYVVAARRRESAIRIALGAAPRHVVQRAVAWIAAVVLSGIAVGLVIAAAAAGSLAPLLFEVSALDPGAVAGVSAIVIVVAISAGYLPAWRASRADPMNALRAE
jgi:putative ABC transport system permease protein